MASKPLPSALSQNQAVNTAEIQQRAEAQRRLLFGPGNSELNLKAVKDRALALRKSIDDMASILQFQPETLVWADVVDRFGVIFARLEQLSEQLRPLTKFYIVRPLSVNQTNAERIPILLSTMKLPEMEKEEVDLLKDHSRDVAREGLVPFYERLGSESDTSSKIVEDLSSFLSPKGEIQQAMATYMRQAIDQGAAKVGPDESPEAKALLAAAMGLTS